MKNINDSETYRYVDGYPDYLITSHGRVFSLKYGKIRELKKRKFKNGYYTVILSKNGVTTNKYIHLLVAQAFIPNPDNKPQVNHIDENKTNNDVSNLEWVTSKENCNHGTRSERMSKKHCKKVMAKSITETKVMVFKSGKSAEKYGFNQGDISKCCRGKIKTHKGYTWQFIDKDKNK